MTATGAVVLGLTLVAVTVTDLRRRVIPNRIVLGAGLFGLALALVEGPRPLAAATASAVLVSAPLLVAALIRPEGMGMGDVKLVALIGLFMGWQAWPAVLIGLGLGGLAGALYSLGTRRPPSQTVLPLAPFLALGTVPAMLSSVQLLQ
ncbi:MAG: prepilin peptidase [Acidobacteriota bacterium]